eukprot:gene20509-biopygen20605
MACLFAPGSACGAAFASIFLLAAPAAPHPGNMRAVHLSIYSICARAGLRVARTRGGKRQQPRTLCDFCDFGGAVTH